MKQIKIAAASIVMGLALLASPPEAVAHQPHDVVSTIAVSPAFSSDQTVFMSRPPSATWRIVEAMRSTDRGLTWEGVPKGLDNTGKFSSAIVSPNFATDATVFLTAAGDGVYRSQDGGDSWVSVNTGLPSLDLRDSAIALNGSDVLELFVLSTEGGIYRSDNLGDSWTELLSPASAILAFALSPDFATDSTVLTADLDSLFRVSTDGGDSWQERGTIADAGLISMLTPVPGFSTSGLLFVGSYGGGIYRSENSGASFVKVSGGLPPGPAPVVAASPSFEADATLFVAMAEEAAYRSTDGGDTWQLQDVPARLTDQTPFHFYRFVFSDAFATDGTVFLSGYEGAYRSLDGGTTWRQIETQGTDLLTDVAFSANYATSGIIAAATYGGGAQISTDRGETWNVANIGLKNRFVYDIAPVPVTGEPLFFAGHVQHLLAFAESTRTWFTSKFPPPAETHPTRIAVSPAFETDRTVFVSARGNGLLASFDGGRSWNRQFLEDQMRSVHLSPQFETDDTLFVTTRLGEIRRSNDRGNAWVTLGTELPAGGQPVWIALSPGFGEDGTVLAGTVDGLHQSNDSGGSWQRMTGHPIVSEGVVAAVAISPDFVADGMILASLRGEGLFRSLNRGDTWTPVGATVIDDGFQIKRLEFSPDFKTDRTIYGVAGSHLIRSFDGGDSWAPTRLGIDRTEEDDEEIQYTGEWTSVSADDASSFHLQATFAADAEASLQFVGTGIAWIGVKGPILGLADVFIDGALVETVDQSAGNYRWARTLFSVQGLPAGQHEIRIVARGQGGATSVDALDVSQPGL